MSQEMDGLVSEVAQMKTVVEGAEAAFVRIAAQIEAAAGDRERSLALAEEVRTMRVGLAEAVAAVPAA